jgi:hypothetical protein
MPAPNKYFIQEHLHREVFHGGITNIDAERVLLASGYKAIVFPGTFDFSFRAKLKRFVYLVRIFLTISAGDRVVFQFPLYARIHAILLKLLRIRKAHIVCLIADIEGLRMLDNKLVEQEKKLLRRFSLFISHNERMSQWIRSLVPKAVIAEIQFFDFLTPPIDRPGKKSLQIAFAGNLQKSPFIQHLEQVQGECPNTTFLIYGPGYPKHLPFPANAVYKGIFPPYETVKQLEGSFGLIWDGPSVSTCSGIYGEYLAYNSPHKLSLYILAGIPLIVPAISASALLVKRYGIGITIKQLDHIETAISAISDAEYQQMVENTRRLAVGISQGKRLEGALHELWENKVKIYQR